MWKWRSNALRPSSSTLGRIGAYALVLLCLSGCAPHVAVSPPLAPTASASANPGWVETQLYFGLGPADHPEQGISEARWRQFLDAEVSPRFPAGFSVVDVYGQWQGARQTTPERLRSKQMIILHMDASEPSAKIEEIRAAWKKLTGDESVLRVSRSAAVSF